MPSTLDQKRVSGLMQNHVKQWLLPWKKNSYSLDFEPFQNKGLMAIECRHLHAFDQGLGLQHLIVKVKSVKRQPALGTIIGPMSGVGGGNDATCWPCDSCPCSDSSGYLPLLSRLPCLNVAHRVWEAAPGPPE